MYQDYIFPSGKNPSYKDMTIEHVFMTDSDSSDYIQCIHTSIDVLYKFTPGSYSSSAESPYDYYDQYEIVSWRVNYATDEEGNYITPDQVLTEEELVKYHLSLIDFMEG